MEVLGFMAALLIGFSLGLVGGGGSILTVPVLVYIFGIDPVLSTSYSLFIVGATSLAGAFGYYRQGHLSFRTAFLFGLSSIVTVFLMRKWVVPALPEIFFSYGSFVFSKSLAILLLFALLMLLAAFSMIRGWGTVRQGVSVPSKRAYLPLLGYGLLVGVVTGLLGAGGGFLLIPTLVLFVRLSMKEAVGTSLLIIAMNALIGFLGDWGHYKTDWSFLLQVSGIAFVGMWLGKRFGMKIEGAKLQKGFGWFVLLMGLLVLVQEIFHGVIG